MSHGHSSQRREGSVARSNEVIVSKLQNMGELRCRFEDLTEMQRSEEESLKETMAGLVRHAVEDEERVMVLEDQVAAYKRLLEQEEGEKLKALEMVAQFKQEGEQIIEKLKGSLKEMTEKYNAEHDRRVKVESEVAAKLDCYKQLLEQQEQVTRQFKDKNAQLEMKLKNAERLVGDITHHDGLNKDYKGILSELKGFEKARQPIEEDRGIEHKLKLQDQIIQMLYAKLKSEQTHRLETEEQAASMVAAEEDTIRKLEDKLREVEAEKERGTPRIGTPRAGNMFIGTPILTRGLESPSPDGARGVPIQRPPPATLESQLAEVTKDFNQSLEMWSKKLRSPGVSSPNAPKQPEPLNFADDVDYFPDSPLQPRGSSTRRPADPLPLDFQDDDFLPDSPNPPNPMFILAADL
eukprot:TRINITY_DN24630_c0_g1_i1.p1 TRINITY_DN24630_c0_g1~~TRINITY_DN24630_c0_g1_i1.p1  ORF type:complete len:408 (+),score=89.78 TRINITY_DN24630_c0_g1_i1:19-1242(+)